MINGIDIYDTHTMLAAIDIIPPRHTFLRQRYFNETTSFPTKDVVIDFKDEHGNRLAPFVLPRKGGIPVAREGYETEVFSPALVAPERPLTADDLMSRQAGEAIFSGKKAAEREASYLKDDIESLNHMIDNREEYLAAQVMLNNGYVMKQYSDKYGGDEYVEREIKFYNGDSNPAVYTPSNYWNTTDEAILDDIHAMAQINIKRGLPMTDLIVSEDVADVILKNEYILKLLDNRRYILADKVSPTEEPNGTVQIADLNVKGHKVNIFSYTAEYTDEDGIVKPYIPSGKVIMTAPNIGKILYGAITHISHGSDHFETFMSSRVPKISVDEHGSVRTLTMQSRPLVMPKVRNPFISATVLESGEDN